MDTQLRPTGIERVGDRPWGIHFCLFYQTKEDLLDLLIPYFKAGLENHEYCLYVASEPVIAAEAERAMREAVPNFDRYLADGQFEIISHLNWYLTEGRFEPLRVRQGWIDKLDQSLARGYAGMRFAANVFWLERQDWDRFADYEGKLDEVFCKLRIMAVCAYALERCSATDMLDVVRHHQFTLARRSGAWERVDGPELQRAHEEIRQLNADLERQVEERTAQLVAANEQLKGEIAERKRSEEALRASEDRLQAAIEAADLALWDWDLASGQVTWLGHQEELFGFAPGEFDGTDRGLANHVHPDDLEELNRVARHAREAGSVFAHEYRVIWHDGSIQWIAARGRFVYNETGEPVRMYGALREVTERKRAEETVRESQQLLRLVLATLPVGVQVIDRAGDIVLVNDASKRIWGGMIGSGPERWTQTKAFWHDSGKRIAPTDWASVRALSEGQTNLNELIDVETYDGQKKTIHNSVAPIRNAEGLIVGAVMVNEDITERKRAEEALRQSEADYRALADNSVQGILIAQDRKIVYANPAMSRINGYTVEELKSMSVEQITALTHPIDRSMAAERARKRLAGEALSPSVELRILRRDGSTGWVQAFNNPIEYHGQPALLSTLIDITERKQAETTIRSLLQISEKLTATLDIDALLDALVIEAMKLIDAELGWSGLRTEEGMVCHTHITRDWQIVPFKYLWPPGVGLPGWVLVHKAPYLMNDAQSDKLIIPEIRERFGVKAAIDTPILDAQGEVIGFFEVNNKKNGAGFSESDVEKLVAVSRTASVALQNAMSYANLERAEETIRLQSARTQLLADISQTFAQAGLDYQGVLKTVARRMAEFFGDACVITLFSDDKQRSYPVAFHHPDPEALALMQAALMHTWQGGTDTERYSTFLSGESVFMPVVKPEEFRASLKPEFWPYLEKVGISSVLIVPLRLPGQVIGTLGLTRDRSGAPYRRDDQVLLQDLADRAALTIQNARLFQAVHEHRDRLRVLSARLVEAQEAERRHIARELHDEIGQVLTGLRVTLQMSSRQETDALRASLDRAQQLVGRLMDQIQDLSLGLRPTMLDDLGLVPALLWHIERYRQQTGIQVQFEQRAAGRRFAPQVETAAYRIVQEALTNVARHARVQEVAVHVGIDNGTLSVQIEDAGAGFDVAAALSTSAASGLSGMRERAELLGGELTIESAPGAGTQITAELPVGHEREGRPNEPHDSAGG